MRADPSVGRIAADYGTAPRRAAIATSAEPRLDFKNAVNAMIAARHHIKQSEE